MFSENRNPHTEELLKISMKVGKVLNGSGMPSKIQQVSISWQFHTVSYRWSVKGQLSKSSIFLLCESESFYTETRKCQREEETSTPHNETSKPDRQRTKGNNLTKLFTWVMLHPCPEWVNLRKKTKHKLLIPASSLRGNFRDTFDTRGRSVGACGGVGKP